MNHQQKIDYWYSFHRFQQRHEAIYTPKFQKVLREQIKQYTDSGTLVAVTAAPVYPVLVELYKEVGRLWAHKSQLHTRTLKSRQPMGFSQHIIDLIKQYYGIDLLNDAEGLTETTRDQIRRVLQEAATSGIGFSDIVKQLENPELTVSRARLIARTETVAAANAGSLINAIDSGLDSDKIWISARDNRTRPHHREVDNHIVSMNADFIVGGLPMKAPGDKRGGAQNCCNCRCVVAFVPKD